MQGRQQTRSPPSTTKMIGERGDGGEAKSKAWKQTRSPPFTRMIGAGGGGGGGSEG